MRDPVRIDEFCERLAAAWKNAPDCRFGQLVCNMQRWLHSDLFYYEDDKMIRYIETFMGGGTVDDRGLPSYY